MSVWYRTIGDPPQVSEGRKLVGYAARFNQTAEIIERGQRFKERIAPGAFTRALSHDIHGLINHDRNLVLGRNTAGTLHLEQDKKGLAFELDPPDTQYARDLVHLIERGDVSQCSFGAGLARTRDSWAGSVRTLEEIDCFDVSIVSVLPGYPGTSVTLRFDELDADPLTIHHRKARAWAALLGGT